MAVIDKEVLVEDIKFWLPSSNTVNDAGITKISNYVIATVGDDEDNYEEILCTSIKAVAIKNKNDDAVNGSSMKMFQYGNTREEYFKNSKSSWQKFIDSIAETCVQFGYVITTTDDDGELSSLGGILINNSDDIDLFEDYEDKQGYPSESSSSDTYL